jgi:type IV secretion system protein VirB10
MSGPERESARASMEAPEEERDEAPASTPIVHDPKAFSLRGDPPRVMRLSRKTLTSIGAVTCLAIGGALFYALQPPARNDAPNLVDTESTNRADSVTGAPKDYSQVPKLGQPLPGDLGRPILSAQANGQPVPTPPMGQPVAQPVDPQLAEAQQARQRILQERDSARTSRLFLGAAANGGGNSDQPALQMASAPITDAAPPPAAAPGGKRGFLQVATNRATISSERVTAPVSPYVLQAGSIIPAALLTGIQSDLPGQITAQVTQNVYDSPTGRILLIPQGSRLIGEYDSEVSAGQNRVLLAWDRLILPGGRSILLDRQPGADASGIAGIKDGVNYHWGNMLKAALISTMLGIGTELATDSNDDLVQALRYGTQDTINQTGRQVVQREVNVPPTLTVRPGHILRVLVTRDLVLEPLPGEQ